MNISLWTDEIAIKYTLGMRYKTCEPDLEQENVLHLRGKNVKYISCLLYTSDAADEPCGV